MIQCPECGSLLALPVKRAHVYTARPAPWWMRVLGFPDFARRRAADLVLCAECGFEYLVTASGPKRTGLSRKQQRPPETRADQEERQRGKPLDDDLPWRLE